MNTVKEIVKYMEMFIKSSTVKDLLFNVANKLALELNIYKKNRPATIAMRNNASIF